MAKKIKKVKSRKAKWRNRYGLTKFETAMFLLWIPWLPITLLCKGIRNAFVDFTYALLGGIRRFVRVYMRERRIFKKKHGFPIEIAGFCYLLGGILLMVVIWCAIAMLAIVAGDYGVASVR